MRALLSAQATSRVGDTPPTDAEAPELLPAADWLLTSAAAACAASGGSGSGGGSGGGSAGALTPAKAVALRACFQAAGCTVGEAALDALSAGRTPPALPQREACLLCDAPVGVGLEGSDMQRCEAGHELQRCWVCLRLLPLRAWLCTCCGAGCCEEHEATPAAGVLCRVSPPGVCGLCGSPCSPPLPGGTAWP